MNGDGLLSREELTFFLHPEESPLMTDVIAEVNKISKEFRQHCGIASNIMANSTSVVP